MRIRRKKHLKERLDAVSDILIVPLRDIVNVKEAVKDKKYISYTEQFGNDNPVSLEIGCGKGSFIKDKALAVPNENFIAVELLENIIVMAAELAKKSGVTNVRYMNSGAEYLPRYIAPQTIKDIYLNFSPPFPGDAYENRRLTCDRRIVEYKEFLDVGGHVYQKTDDKEFFLYSLEQFKKHGFIVEDVSQKIQNNQIDNIKTEYENKFTQLGLPIYALIATKQ